jgi:NADPH:quinone reductase-like Zn-dependent oxidoreductase
VIAPGLPEDQEYLRDLGTTELLDRSADTAAAVRERYPNGVDALLDLVSYSPDDFNANAAVLKDGGRAAAPLSAAGDGPGRTNIMAVPSAENLDRLAEVLDAGILRVHIQKSYPLEQAGDALEALGATHTQGKLSIRVAS